MKRPGKCVNKKPFAYKTDAERIVLKAAKQGTFLRIYECPTCLDFHLTSKGLGIRYVTTLKNQVNYTPPAKTKRIKPCVIRKRTRNMFMYCTSKTFSNQYTWKIKLYLLFAKLSFPQLNKK